MYESEASAPHTHTKKIRRTTETKCARARVRLRTHNWIEKLPRRVPRAAMRRRRYTFFVLCCIRYQRARRRGASVRAVLWRLLCDARASAYQTVTGMQSMGELQ